MSLFVCVCVSVHVKVYFKIIKATGTGSGYDIFNVKQMFVHTWSLKIYKKNLNENVQTINSTIG